MATILTIKAKGNTQTEINKNLEIIDSYMNSVTILKLVSSIRPNFNPRIYYNETTIIPKNIQDIVTFLRTDKTINHAIKEVAYVGHLNKV